MHTVKHTKANLMHSSGGKQMSTCTMW